MKSKLLNILVILAMILSIFGLATPVRAELSTGSVSGHVYQSDNTTPVTGAEVMAFRFEGLYPLGPLAAPSWQTVADESGNYTLSLPPGDYLVFAFAEGYDRRFFPDTIDPVEAQPVNVTSGTDTSGIDFGLGPGGTISGTVTDNATGQPLAQVSVYAQEAVELTRFWGLTLTDEGGNYKLIGLPYGSYLVVSPAILRSGSGDNSYMPQVWQGKTIAEADAADPVVVTEGVNPSGINFPLQVGGTISGYVYQSDNATPIEGAGVTLFDYSALPERWNFRGAAVTDAQGYYQTLGLPAGEYAIRAEAPGYIGKFYDNKYGGHQADPVEVTAPVNTPNINLSLEVGGTITGRVTDNATGLPIANIHVYALDFATNEWMAGTNTDASGNYTFVVPTGTYKVGISVKGSGLNYIEKFYYDKYGTHNADPVEVTAPGVSDNINFSLEPGASISGTVMDQATGLPVNDASTGNITLSAGWHKFVYRHQEREGGQAARAAFKAPGDADWRWFSTSQLEIRTSPDLGAESGLLLVTKKDTWDKHPENHAELVQLVDFDSTNETGWYGSSVVSIVNQSENIHGNDDYYTSYYEGYFYVETPGVWHFSTDSDDASEIMIDDQLIAYWYSGHGKADRWEHKMEIRLNEYGTNKWRASARGNADGSYTFTGIPSGSYIIQATAPGYVDQWYDNKYGRHNADPVEVTAPGERGNINFSLEIGGTITGRVTDNATGLPIANLHVNASDFETKEWMAGSNTNADGYYTLVVPTGTYKVGTHPSNTGLNYVGKFYVNKYGMHNADPVEVTAPGERGNINFSLEIGGTITGRVTDNTTGQPIANLHVNAHNFETDDWIAGANTDASGNYTLVVPTGTYRVGAHPSVTGLNYIVKFYDNKYFRHEAGPVDVTAPEERPDIDFSLEALVPRSTIEGAIADGVAWLASQQNPDGSWGTYYQVAKTALAVLKLETHAADLGMSPFDPAYSYFDEIQAGFNFLFLHAYITDVTVQPAGNPDTNGNGTGVYFRSPSFPPEKGHAYDIYETSMVLMAIGASPDPRVLAVPGSVVEGWTYAAVAQDAVDYLAWGQTDFGFGRGGWNYGPMNNQGERSDQSNAGWVTLGLMYAKNFGSIIPGFVRSELEIWIDYIQDKSGGPDDGGSWYTGPTDTDSNKIIGANMLRTGNLLQQMAFVGDTSATPRVQAAIDYLVRHWGKNADPGWRGDPTCYHTTYTVMKGLEQLGIHTIDSIDWFQDFSDAIMAEQSADGWWMPSRYDDGERILSTAWALLTLQKEIPPTEMKPDLIVLEKHEEWVNEADGTYRVHFTIKNRGNVSVPDVHHVGLTVNGILIEEKAVAMVLEPGSTYFDSFDTVLTLTQPHDEITVCADYRGMVDELNEGNNCLANYWPPAFPDLVISEKYETWDVEGESYTVHYTVTNNGDAPAQYGHVVRIIIDSALATQKPQPRRVEYHVVPVALGPGESYSGSVGGINLTGGWDSVTVVADVYNYVAESDEGNNRRMNTIAWPPAPDLVVEIGEEWLVGGGSYVIHFNVRNIGNAPAPANHNVSLKVDGTGVDVVTIPVSLDPGTKYMGSFGPVTLSEGVDHVIVYADSNDNVSESREGNNWQHRTIAWPPAPDLVVMQKFETWVEGQESTKYTVHFFVRNIGNALAPAGHDVQLKVDGVMIGTVEVPVALNPGGIWSGEFLTELTLTGGSNNVMLIADVNNEVAESDESNNALSNIWPHIDVKINAPPIVPANGDFIAVVNISQVQNFDAANFDVFFNPAVLRLDDVTVGNIGGVTVPVTGWNEREPGRFTIVANIPGTTGANGDGALAVLHFHVVGSLGQNSGITLGNGVLSSTQATEIFAEWWGAFVEVGVIPGDANGDGLVNAIDITKVERIIAHLDPPTPGADANQDGNINALDITKVERIIVGLD